MPIQHQRRRSSRQLVATSATSSASASSHNNNNDLALLHKVNDATKWTVSAATALVLARKNADPATRWAVVGAVSAAFVTKILKRIIDEARPATAVKKSDPGMPSSHAQSLAFLATSAARAIVVNGGSRTTSSSNLVPAALVLATAVLLATLRVTLGYHTWPQVVVGGILGCFFALGWAEVGARYVVPLVGAGNNSNAVSVALGIATAVAVVVFGTVTVRSWWREKDKGA